MRAGRRDGLRFLFFSFFLFSCWTVERLGTTERRGNNSLYLKLDFLRNVQETRHI